MKKTFSGDIPGKSFSSSGIWIEVQMAGSVVMKKVMKKVLFIRTKKMKKAKKTYFHMQNSGV